MEKKKKAVPQVRNCAVRGLLPSPFFFFFFFRTFRVLVEAWCRAEIAGRCECQSAPSKCSIYSKAGKNTVQYRRNFKGITYEFDTRENSIYVGLIYPCSTVFDEYSKLSNIRTLLVSVLENNVRIAKASKLTFKKQQCVGLFC